MKLFNMKRLFILLALVASLCCAGNASAQIVSTGRKSSHVNPGAGATSVTTITGQVLGNTNIVGVAWCNDAGCATSTAAQTFTVTDGAGNSYSSADKRINTSASQDLAMAAVHASTILTSASNQLTLTITGGTPFYAMILVSEWPGILNLSPQDQTGSVDTANGTASPLSITAAGATTQASELVYAFAHSGNLNPTLFAGAGYTIINQPDNQDADEYQVVSSIATYTATFTYSGTASQMGVLVTYKAAPSGSRFVRAMPAPVLPVVTYLSTLGRWALTDKERIRA